MSLKFMIVDDSVIMRKVIEKYSSQFDLDVVGTVSNGKDAIELFKETIPDIVSLDITMPEVDGLECLKEIIQIKPEVKVIMITALADKETGIAALKMGAKGFLSKPFTPEEFKEEFEQVIS